MRTLAILAVIATSSLAHAGVSVQRAHRMVSGFIDEFEPPAGASRSSDRPGRFDEVAEYHVMNELLDHSDVKTTQNSTIGDGFVSASGSFFAGSSGDLVTFSNTIDA